MICSNDQLYRFIFCLLAFVLHYEILYSKHCYIIFLFQWYRSWIYQCWNRGWDAVWESGTLSVEIWVVKLAGSGRAQKILICRACKTSLILSSVQLPLPCFDFSKISGFLVLTNYHLTFYIILYLGIEIIILRCTNPTSIYTASQYHRLVNSPRKSKAVSSTQNIYSVLVIIMAAGRVAVLAVVMWVALAALAAADGGYSAPAPSPSGAAGGGIPSLKTILLGVVAAAVSFSTLKELIWLCV